MLTHLHGNHPLPMPLLDPYGNRPPQYPVPEAEEFSIRIMCASELISPVIGKSGANVKQVKQQTGPRILVQELDKDASGERLIVISSKEIPADPISPAIEALILLHIKVSAPSEKRHLVARLVVQKLQGYLTKEARPVNMSFTICAAFQSCRSTSLLLFRTILHTFWELKDMLLKKIQQVIQYFKRNLFGEDGDRGEEASPCSTMTEARQRSPDEDDDRQRLLSAR